MDQVTKCRMEGRCWPPPHPRRLFLRTAKKQGLCLGAQQSQESVRAPRGKRGWSRERTFCGKGLCQKEVPEGTGPVSGRGLREGIPSARDSDTSYRHGIQASSLQTVRPQPGEIEWGGGRGSSFPGTRVGVGTGPSFHSAVRVGLPRSLLSEPSAPGVLAMNGGGNRALSLPPFTAGVGR